MKATLKKAISVHHVSLAAVQKILPIGTLPTEDINHFGFQRMTLLHQILFNISWLVKYDREPGEQQRQAKIQELKNIFHYLLVLRDPDGFPLVDLKVAHVNVGTVLSEAVGLGMPDLVQALVDVRLPDGQPAIDINTQAGGPENFFHPLFRAVFLGRQEITEQLHDLRLEDGSYAISLENQQIALRAFENTRRPNDCSNWLRRRLAGALQQRQQPQPAPAARQPTQAADAQAERFNNNSQNTHDSSVTQTAKTSLLALGRRYSDKLPQNERDNNHQGAEQALKEIEKLIDATDFTTIRFETRNSSAEKKADAKTFLQLIWDKLASTHSHTGYNIATIIQLVWAGVNDKRLSSYPEEMLRPLPTTATSAPDYYIQTKQSSLIEKFIEATRTYPNGSSICVVGSIHKILESLNRAHADVTIITGQGAVKPAATEMSVSLLGAELRKLPIAEQGEILASWNATETDSPADKFKQAAQGAVKKRLADVFGMLISESDIEGIVANLEYAPRPPVPTAELSSLVDDIENKLQPTGCAVRVNFIKQLQRKAVNVYLDHDTAAEQHIATLRASLERLNTCDKFLKIEEEGSAERVNFVRQIQQMAVTIFFELDEASVEHMAALRTFVDEQLTTCCDILTSDSENYEQMKPFFLMSIKQLTSLSLLDKNILQLVGMDGRPQFFAKLGETRERTTEWNIENSAKFLLDKLPEYKKIFSSIDELETYETNTNVDDNRKQASALRGAAKDFILAKLFGAGDEEVNKIKGKFSTTLNTLAESKHRAVYKPILLNIAIAATGIGLFVVLGHLAVTGRGLFSKTRRRISSEQIEKNASSTICTNLPLRAG